MNNNIMISKKVSNSPNYLTFIKIINKVGNKNKWGLFKCACGNEKELVIYSVTSNNTKSCGCITYNHRYKDLTGLKFNRWTVIKFDKRVEFSKPGSYGYYWLCQCICGNIKSIESSGLKSGNTSSCGCFKRESLLCKNKEIAALNKIYSTYKTGAINRGLNFNLTKSELYKIVYSNCYLCTRKPSNTLNLKQLNYKLIYNGIDRIDNNKGYSIDNCKPCCFICNAMKTNHSFDFFISHIKKILQNV